jgi:glycosyltransferase involved in cell wall biosynthesis
MPAAARKTANGSFPPAERRTVRRSLFAPGGADVCLVLEGTYPYVSGGVSSWVHTIIESLAARRFSLLHIGPHPDAYGDPIYELPDNIVGLQELYCHAGLEGAPRQPPSRRRRRKLGGAGRVLSALRRIHLGAPIDDGLVEDLASGDLTLEAFLHGAEPFELIRDELYPAIAPGTPFTEFFWHVRAMHVPLLRLLSADLPDATMFHAVSCGYAGIVAAAASVRHGRPLTITEHGLYAREREMELANTTWIRDFGAADGGPMELSPLRRMWSRYFLALSRIAYQRASHLITLSAVNRDKQIADGAPADKLEVIPNGVDPDAYADIAEARLRRTRVPDRPMRIGFVGRVVPIKDVVTLIRAVALALESVDLELWIVGPEDEDPAYAARCRALVNTLGLHKAVQFLGRRNVHEIYPDLDAMVLTSLSEGQPLVILEGNAAALPVIATDVGACRELLTGRDPKDASYGPSGIVTRVASPADTAEAMVKLAKQPRLRYELGLSGVERVRGSYRLQDVVAEYGRHYLEKVSS